MTRHRSNLKELVTALNGLKAKVPGYPYDLALLTRLASYVERQTAELAQAILRPYDLTPAQYQVLVMIHSREKGRLSASELAQASGEKPTNLTHICDELDRRGLIDRVRDQKDRRRVCLRMTKAGKTQLRQVQPELWALWEQRFKGIPLEQRELLTQLLRQQYANLAGSEDER